MTYDHGACWRCIFFEQDESDARGGGFCRRYPPVPAFDGDDAMVLIAGVEALDWCGEFVEEC